MMAEKTFLLFGLASLTSLAICAVATAVKKRSTKKSSKNFKIDENTKWVLDCLDDMVTDIKQLHKAIEGQGKSLAQMEARIDNVNNRMDNIVGGK